MPPPKRWKTNFVIFENNIDDSHFVE